MKKALLIIAAVVFVLLASLWVYVQSDAFSARIRPLVAGPLQEVLGPGADIGKVKATLLPLVLEVRDIRIPSPVRKEAIAVRKVRIYINPFPLLYHTLSLSSITILEPRITAERSIEGRLDLEDILDSVRRNIERRNGGAPSSWRLQVRTVTIRNGQLTFSDDASRVHVSTGRLNCTVQLTGGQPPRGIVRVSSASILLSAPSYPRYEAALEVAGSFAGNRVDLASFALHSPQGRISASGSFVASATGAVDIRLSSRSGAGYLERLTGVLKRKTERSAVLETHANITGTVDHPVLDGSIEVRDLSLASLRLERAGLAVSYQDGSVQVDGSDWVLKRGQKALTVSRISIAGMYRSGELQIDRAILSAGNTEVQASGSIGTAMGYQVSLSAHSSGRSDVLALLSGLEASGEAAVQGKLTGGLKSPVFEGSLSAGPVSVGENRFDSITGSLRFHDRSLVLIGATIRQDVSRYLLDATATFEDAGPRFQAKLSIIRSDVVSVVALFYKRIPLRLSASGELTFSGTLTAYTGTGHLEVDSGEAYGESFDRGSIAVELNESGVTFTRVELEKGPGRVEGTGRIGFDGTYGATIEGSDVELSRIDLMRDVPLTGAVSFSIASSGTFHAPLVHAHAVSTSLAVRRLALGAAEADLDIRVQRMTVSVSAGSPGGTGVTAKGAMAFRGDYPWDLKGTVRLQDGDPSTVAEASELLSKIRLTARMNFSLTGRGSGLDAVSGSIVLPQLLLSMGELRAENRGDVHITVAGGAVQVRNFVLEGTGTNLVLGGSVRPGRDVNLTLDGDVNLSLLRMFFREIEHGDGAASLRLVLHDGWTHPDIEGKVSVRDGVVKVRDIPQRFTAINGVISFDREHVATEGLTAEVGGGKITINGTARLKGMELADFSARAAAENVTVRYPPGMTAQLAGTLYYDGDPSVQTLSGEISIQKARYEKRIEWKSMLLDVSRGFTRKKKTDIGWIGETQLNIHCKGDENILFESNLAKIPLKIDILLRGTVNQVSLLGRVEAREGEVYFRNNVFKIIYASADMVDPNRLNPVLDVQAETRVRDYKIRLAVSGSADRAVVSFLSDPPLPDSDILALLALGKTGEELKGKEANVGMSEAASFATGKFQDMFESRARSLTGLDRFQVDPYINKSDNPVPRVTVGKEMLQDRLYLTYSSNVGGTTPEQNFHLEYILNRNMSLIGEYDELGQIGADLKFRFEFR